MPRIKLHSLLYTNERKKQVFFLPFKLKRSVNRFLSWHKALFHQLLQCSYQLIYNFVLTIPNIVSNAGTDVISQQFFIKSINSGTCGCRLNKNIRAIRTVLNHAANTTNLSFNTVKTVDQLGIFFGRTFFLMLGAETAVMSGGFFHFSPLPT